MCVYLCVRIYICMYAFILFIQRIYISICRCIQMHAHISISELWLYLPCIHRLDLCLCLLLLLYTCICTCINARITPERRGATPRPVRLVRGEGCWKEALAFRPPQAFNPLKACIRKGQPVYTCVCISTCTCIQHMSTCSMYIHIFICICTYIYTRICIRKYVHTHISTLTHEHTRSFTVFASIYYVSIH